MGLYSVYGYAIKSLLMYMKENKHEQYQTVLRPESHDVL